MSRICRQGHPILQRRGVGEAEAGSPFMVRRQKKDCNVDWRSPKFESLSNPASSSLPRLEEPFVARIRINNIEARCLIDTGASGDFVSSHFTFVNRLKHRKLDSAIPIQQAVKGSKPKCNAIATATIQFGDWSKKTSLYVIHLANYDAIIGLPTLMDAGARFDLSSNTLHLQEYDVSLPLERYQPVARPQRKVPAPHAPAGTPSDFGKDLSVASATVIDESAPIPATPPVFLGLSRRRQDTARLIIIGISSMNTTRMYSSINCRHNYLLCAVVNHRIPVKIEKPWMTPLYRLPEHHKKALGS